MGEYLGRVGAAARRRGSRAVLDDVAGHLAGSLGTSVPGELGLGTGPRSSDPCSDVEPPTALARPELLGQVYEALVDGADRRRRGAYFTPPSLAAQLAEATLGPLLDAGVDPAGLTVCDPGAGGGALLLAAGRLLAARGADLGHVVAHQLHGVDLDPMAAAVARTSLMLLGRTSHHEETHTEASVVCGDALSEVEWPGPGMAHYDAVIANPPFLSQLQRGTARSREVATRLGGRFGEAALGYADEATLFMLLGLELVRPGGLVGILLPEPVLAARDAAPMRRRAGSRSHLLQAWSVAPRTFDAGVHVCAAVVERVGRLEQAAGLEHAADRQAPEQPNEARPAPGPRQRAVAAGDEPCPDAETGARRRATAERWRDGDWALIVADATGVPVCEPRSDGTLARVATCSADFRDQYYGVAAIIIDDPDPGPVARSRPGVITCGLIDPARLGWGVRVARVAHGTLLNPRADLDRLPTAHPLRRWASARLVPKVVLATQTLVLEAAGDPRGEWLPMVPVISVMPDSPARLWHILAVLNAPPLAAECRRRHAGTALSRDAIKLSARQVAALPLPADHAAWDVGARYARQATAAGNTGDVHGWRAALGGLASAMCAAYGVAPARVVPWWEERVERIAARSR